MDITKAPSWQKVLDAMSDVQKAKGRFARQKAERDRKAAISVCVKEMAEEEGEEIEVVSSPFASLKPAETEKPEKPEKPEKAENKPANLDDLFD